MSHINVELHEKYMYEHIEDSEYQTVHEEMQKLGYLREVLQGGIDHHLPRSCYFNINGTSGDVERAYTNVKGRLSREISVAGTIGNSYGYGLRPVIRSPIMRRLNSLTSHPYGSLVGFVGKPE